MTATAVAVPALASAPVAARRRDLADGSRAMAPLLLGVAPFGLAIGAAASSSALGPLAGWSTSWVIFSGTPQLLTLQLADAGAPAASILLAVALVNLRLTVYATALVPAWRGSSRRWRALAAYLLTDPCFVVARRDAAAGLPPEVRRDRYLGAALTLWVGWLAVCAAGVALGDRLGGALPAALVLQLVLVAMVRPVATEPTPRRVAATAFGLAAAAAAVDAATGASLPAGLDPLAAALGAAAIWWPRARAEGARHR